MFEHTMDGVKQFAHDSTDSLQGCLAALQVTRIWTPPVLQAKNTFGFKVRLHAYIRPLSWDQIARAMMAYSRVCSLSP